MFIKKILVDTFDYGIENKTKIYESLKYPGLGVIITSLLSNNDFEANIIQDILLLLINGYFYTIFAINCHRLFLDKDVPNGLVPTLKWNSRNTSFLLTTIALVLSMAVCTAPLIITISWLLFDNTNNNQFFEYFVLFVGTLPISYLFARFSLVLPATAIDSDNSWSTAWDISRGYGWKLCFLISIFPFLTGCVFDAISSTSIVAKLLIPMFSIVVLFYEISILSNSYKVLYSKAKATQQGAVGGLA